MQIFRAEFCIFLTFCILFVNLVCKSVCLRMSKIAFYALLLYLNLSFYVVEEVEGV